MSNEKKTGYRVSSAAAKILSSCSGSPGYHATLSAHASIPTICDRRMSAA